MGLEMPKLAFPRVQSFRSILVDDSKAKEFITEDTGHCIGTLFTVRWQDGGYSSLRVRPQNRTLKYIKKSMLALDNDQLYFGGVEHDDGKMLLIVKYNIIIGSRWLARVNTLTVPVPTKEVS